MPVKQNLKMPHEGHGAPGWLAAALIGFLALSPSLSCGAADYVRDIKPLLAEKCTACHGALKQKGGLRLDAGSFIHRGGKNGPAILLDRPFESRILTRVSTSDPDERMPPEGEGEALTPEQIELLGSWIESGAATLEDEDVLLDPREHWAYQVPRRPAVPEVVDAMWSHPIDAFLERKRDEHGLKPVTLADRHTLLRRLHLNLAGIPPTVAEIDAFLANTDEAAWSQTVDKLLANPQYGERWGRHWMDVWRYSDWDGYKAQLRGSARHIWRWRDWIVESLNADKGYDRMIKEMLAGDELAPEDGAVLRATGYLARNFHKSNRNIWLDATVEHSAKAFLGMTIECARCHDHKYDPIEQADYYRFRAIFEPHNMRTDLVGGVRDRMKDGVARAFDKELDAPTYLYARGDEKHPVKDKPMAPELPGIFGRSLKVEAVSLPVLVARPGLRESEVTRARAAVTKALAGARAALKRAEAQLGELASDDRERLELGVQVAELNLKSFSARLAADRARFMSQGGAPNGALTREAADAERATRIPGKRLDVMRKELAARVAKDSKEAEAKKKAAIAKAEKALGASRKALKDTIEKEEAAAAGDVAVYTPIGTVYPASSTGRRLALVRWIASKDNPLTARVAVNQIWLRHFGAPLVDNVFDFGLRSPRPRHAELLDWLAVELMENNWSMKRIHKLILTSRTWRLSSSSEPGVESPNLAADRDNHFYWRMNPRRLEAEIVRDGVLAVTGQMDSTLGGPDIAYGDGEETRRRSVYLQHAYEKQMTMLVLFDAASPNECYRRSTSVVPQQALALLNSPMTRRHSGQLAKALWRASQLPSDSREAEFVRSVFHAILSRPPSEKEMAACRSFLDRQTSLLSGVKADGAGSGSAILPDPGARARENLTLAILNHNDFVMAR